MLKKMSNKVKKAWIWLNRNQKLVQIYLWIAEHQWVPWYIFDMLSNLFS
ncbi:hypothetical protein SAMN05720758_2039 [Fibrobacter sp. UWB11]|nr:hypothetical protein SAMN05720758_2039 [Fibrobacter sp. UWB11]